MKEKIILLCSLISFGVSFGQVGINTENPKATLDITPKKTDGTTPEGIIPPRLTGDALFAAIASGSYSTDQNGAIVYITVPAALANQTGQTIEVNSTGYYYFDSGNNQWKKMANNIYNSDGTLISNRTVTMNGNNLGFMDGRTGMGTQTPDPSAILELKSITMGFLPPRMTQVQMDAIPNPAQGLIIYCTDCYAGNKGCLMVNDSPNPAIPEWGSLCSSSIGGQVSTFQIQCSSANTSGTVLSGIAVSGVTTTVPYTTGNGTTTFNAADFTSSGVTGLTAHLNSGTLSSGNGNFVFNITGTAASTGNANFTITVAGKTCTFSIPVSSGTPSVSSLTCGSATFSSPFTQLVTYTGTLTVPYTGGNGAPFASQTLTSQNGLTFTLSAGTLNMGNGNLVYNVTGAPTNPGTMTIPVSFAGATCSITANVAIQTSVVMCGSSSVWLAHNLGADTSVDSHNPSAVIQGAKYQWGMSSPTVTQAADQASSSSITGWNTVAAANGSWAATKTANDPCPSGYRVPTRAEFQTLFSSSTISRVGTWVFGETNFGSAVIYECDGKKLTFPAAGYRHYQNGTMNQRGFEGDYWTSTESGTNAYDFKFNQSASNANAFNFRQYAYAIRCISE